MKKISAVVCLVVLFVVTASAQNTNPSRLKGDYPFNESLQIIFGSAVNGACPAALSGPVQEFILQNTGTWSFDGAGNVHIVDQGMLIQVPATDASQVVPSVSDCTGTYTLLDANTVDFHYNCSNAPRTYFQVHTTGKITQNNILVANYHRADGSLDITPFVAGGNIVACTYVSENTVISRTSNGQ